MTQKPEQVLGSARLVRLMKAAYWAALAIIGGMVVASFLLLQQMIGSRQEDESLLALANAQKALSQRIVFLANAVETAPMDRKRSLVDSLRHANKTFETNYDTLLAQTQADTVAGRRDQNPFDNLLFGAPHHLDYFSTSLAANGWRIIASAETLLGLRAEANPYYGGSERARLDDAVARATLDGYVALEKHIAAQASQRLGDLMDVHRYLFIGTMSVILLVGLFIFRPMTNLIGRRTEELVAARNEMAHNAVHDGLTGLHNRSFLNGRLATLAGQAARTGGAFALVQFDLDRFKQINDGLGHSAGDFVLMETARRLKVGGGKEANCIRLGGDEFVVLVPACAGRDAVAKSVESMLRAINRPIVHEGTTIVPGASAGVAIFPDDGETAADLMIHADVALYAAKKAGGGSFSFFTSELRRDLDEGKRLEREITTAIANRDFTVCFQPQISLRDGKVAGVEALVRWLHHERGLLAPGQFLGVAERCGLMPAIGRVVFRKAIAAAASWHRDGIEFGRLALNASGAELAQPDFASFLFATLSTEGLPPRRLALEIVESVILDDEKTGIAETLRTIRAAGIQLELDDFGTGYASLSHVDPRQIDRLKVDRRFVHGIGSNPANASIVRALSELARGLGIGIVAEGVETEVDLDLLAAIGCDEVQGYGIAMPMPQAEARAWLEMHAGASTGAALKTIIGRAA